MFEEVDVIKARRVPLIYVCPPFCEAEFSSTAAPTIILSPNRRRRGPTGLRLTNDGGVLTLSWDTVDGAICYNVYSVINFGEPDQSYVLIAECITNTHVIVECATPPCTFVVTVITPDGESEPSDPSVDGGPGGSCPPESLLPEAPDVLEIDDELVWDTMTIDSALFTDWPTFPNQKFQYWPLDYSPGLYDVGYVSGLFDDHDPMNPCDVGKMAGAAVMSHLADDDFNPDTFGFIASNIYDLGPPHIEHIASGFVFCEVSFAADEAQLENYFNIAAPLHRWKNQNEHGNDGGLLLSLFDSNVIFTLNSPPGFEFKLELIQVGGLIPQPRKLAIDDYAAHQGDFSNPAVAAAWNGKFPTRTIYTATDLYWQAAASGSFGGARLSWVANHPYSLNGFGWRLDIFSAGLVLMWRGYKAADTTSEGRFYRYSADTPTGPSCLTVSDDSEIPWFPPEV